ncbi:protein of unknown function [Aminobacter niigataensis]|nr:protein of unknown function [Aminobacter niigataensis]
MWEPQLDAYVSRGINPSVAPSNGCPAVCKGADALTVKFAAAIVRDGFLRNRPTGAARNT